MLNPGHVVAGSSKSDPFPAGLRVLVVDDDPTCLMILERMLTTCLYIVTKCNRAEIALSLLRKNKNGFDIVISDVHMPDMDGFKLLEHVGLEMDLPVIMMSADDSKSVVLKGVTHGAVDYLIKPVRMEALKNIWQHVVRKKRNVSEHSASVEETGGDRQKDDDDDADNNSSSGNSRKRKEEEQGGEDTSSLKKPRVVWSVELHQQFVAAVNQLGVDKAVPKKILEMMNVPGLTRENIASHLQKYRIYLRRLGGVSQHQGNTNHTIMTGQDPSFGPLNGFDIQALAVAGQLPAQSLAQLQAAGLGRPSSLIKPGMSVDQRSLFSFENPKTRFGDAHGHRQTMHMRLQMQQMAGVRGGHNVQSSGMLMPVEGGPSMVPSLGHQQHLLSRRSCLPETSSRRVLPDTQSVFTTFPSELPPLKSFPLASAPGMSVSYQEEVKGGSNAGFGNPSYDIFNDFTQQEQYNNNNNIENTAAPYSTLKRKREAELSVNQIYMNGGSVRVKTETLTCPQATTMFHEQYNQEDLISALLKQEGPLPLLDNEFDFEGYSIDNIPV